MATVVTFGDLGAQKIVGQNFNVQNTTPGPADTVVVTISPTGPTRHTQSQGSIPGGFGALLSDIVSGVGAIVSDIGDFVSWIGSEALGLLRGACSLWHSVASSGGSLSSGGAKQAVHNVLVGLDNGITGALSSSKIDPVRPQAQQLQDKLRSALAQFQGGAYDKLASLAGAAGGGEATALIGAVNTVCNFVGTGSTKAPAPKKSSHTGLIMAAVGVPIGGYLIWRFLRG